MAKERDVSNNQNRTLVFVPAISENELLAVIKTSSCIASIANTIEVEEVEGGLVYHIRQEYKQEIQKAIEGLSVSARLLTTEEYTQLRDWEGSHPRWGGLHPVIKKLFLWMEIVYGGDEKPLREEFSDENFNTYLNIIFDADYQCWDALTALREYEKREGKMTRNDVPPSALTGISPEMGLKERKEKTLVYILTQSKNRY